MVNKTAVVKGSDLTMLHLVVNRYACNITGNAARKKGTCTFLPQGIAANTKFTSLSSLKPAPRASPHFVAFYCQGLCEVVVSPVVWRIGLNAHARLIKGASIHQVNFMSIFMRVDPFYAFAEGFFTLIPD